MLDAGNSYECLDVAWSVCACVCLSLYLSHQWTLQKWLNRSRCRLGGQTRVGCIGWIHGRHLANTIKRSALGSDAGPCHHHCGNLLLLQFTCLSVTLRNSSVLLRQLNYGPYRPAIFNFLCKHAPDSLMRALFPITVWFFYKGLRQLSWPSKKLQGQSR